MNCSDEIVTWLFQPIFNFFLCYNWRIKLYNNTVCHIIHIYSSDATFILELIFHDRLTRYAIHINYFEIGLFLLIQRLVHLILFNSCEFSLYWFYSSSVFLLISRHTSIAAKESLIIWKLENIWLFWNRPIAEFTI